MHKSQTHHAAVATLRHSIHAVCFSLPGRDIQCWICMLAHKSMTQYWSKASITVETNGNQKSTTKINTYIYIVYSTTQKVGNAKSEIRTTTFMIINRQTNGVNGVWLVESVFLVLLSSSVGGCECAMIAYGVYVDWFCVILWIYFKYVSQH